MLSGVLRLVTTWKSAPAVIDGPGAARHRSAGDFRRFAGLRDPIYATKGTAVWITANSAVHTVFQASLILSIWATNPRFP
jgi:hypothetical protein